MDSKFVFQAKNPQVLGMGYSEPSPPPTRHQAAREASDLILQLPSVNNRVLRPKWTRFHARWIRHLTEDLQCHLCLMVPGFRTAILRCRHGHLVCQSCRGQIAFCPVCRSKEPWCRDKFAELAVLLVLLFFVK